MFFYLLQKEGTMKSLMNSFISTICLQMKQSFARPMFRFCRICNPIVNTIFLYEMFLNRGTDAFISYVVLGAGLMGIWSCICFSSVGDINRERYSGTLSLIYVAPEGFGKIILGKIIGNTLLSMTSFFLSWGTAVLLGGKTIHLEAPVYFLLSMFFLILCFIVVSLCLAYALMLSRKTELYMNLLEIPLIFLCGFTFPVEILPVWVQRISNSLPQTWVVRMLKMCVEGFQKAIYIKYCFVFIVELLLFLTITRILYLWIDSRIRKKATLELPVYFK